MFFSRAFFTICHNFLIMFLPCSISHIPIQVLRFSIKFPTFLFGVLGLLVVSTPKSFTIEIFYQLIRRSSFSNKIWVEFVWLCRTMNKRQFEHHTSLIFFSTNDGDDFIHGWRLLFSQNLDLHLVKLHIEPNKKFKNSFSFYNIFFALLHLHYI